MGRRTGTPKEIRDLPPFRSTSGGINLASVRQFRGTWKLSKKGNANTISCSVRLASYDNNNANDPFWQLSITRLNGDDDRLRRQFTASIRYVEKSMTEVSVAPDQVVGRGGANSWAEAIDAVSSCDVHLACAATGATTYYSNRWATVRIFRVLYPWCDPREPNAAYSPFKLIEPFGFDAESDGAVVSCFELKHEAARVFAERAGANAFLLGPTNGEYRLYHREGMTKYDVIDIDEWRARIIAGTRD